MERKYDVMHCMCKHIATGDMVMHIYVLFTYIWILWKGTVAVWTL